MYLFLPAFTFPNAYVWFDVHILVMNSKIENGTSFFFLAIKNWSGEIHLTKHLKESFSSHIQYLYGCDKNRKIQH